MTTSLIPDPFQMWRDALTKLEGNVNSLVTGGMDSQELMRSVHQASTLSLGLQQALEKAIGGYLAKVNLPSRKDVSDLAAALQRVEDKLDRLLPATAPAAAPRPPRTRQPPPDVVAAPAAEAVAATPDAARGAAAPSAATKSKQKANAKAKANATASATAFLHTQSAATKRPAKPARAAKRTTTRARSRS